MKRVLGSLGAWAVCVAGCMALSACGSSGTKQPKDSGIQFGGGAGAQSSGGDGNPSTVEYCGNGITEGGEACDDGNSIDDDACNNHCAKCGDGIVQASETCDDGKNDDAAAGCFECQITPGPIWGRGISADTPLLHSDGSIYALKAPPYDVYVLDGDAKLVDQWDGPMTPGYQAMAWSDARAYELNDGGVLSVIGIGRSSAIDQHVARYSKDGTMKWAVMLPHSDSGSFGDGRYVSALDSQGGTIALAGLEHLGETGVGNSALITLLDPDGVEISSLRYQFMKRESSAYAVHLLSDDELCAAGAQWLASNDTAPDNGWVACWSHGALLWERSLDAPVIAMRTIDAASFEIVTPTALSTVQLADGTVGNRHALIAAFNGSVTFVGENALITDSVTGSARIVDQTAATLWSGTGFEGLALVGLTPSGTAYFSNRSQTADGTLLHRYETGVVSKPDPASGTPLAAATINVGDPAASKVCAGYCTKLAAANCGSLLGQPFWGVPECVTACLRPSSCSAELGTLGACVADHGSLTCPSVDSAPVISGCDDEAKAFTSCSATAI